MFERSKLHPIFVPVHKKLPSQANLPTLPSRINPQLCCLLLWRANIVAGTQPVHCPWGLPHMKSAKFSEFATPPPPHCVHKSADFVPLFCFLGTPSSPHQLRTSYMEAPCFITRGTKKYLRHFPSFLTCSPYVVITINHRHYNAKSHPFFLRTGWRLVVCHMGWTDFCLGIPQCCMYCSAKSAISPPV